MIQAAAKALWGLEVGGSFGFNASWCNEFGLERTNFEKNQVCCLIFSFDRLGFLTSEVERDRACIKLHNKIAGGNCCFPNVLELVELKSGKKWCPENLRIKKTAYCVEHKKMCLGFFNNTVFKFRFNAPEFICLEIFLFYVT